MGPSMGIRGVRLRGLMLRGEFYFLFVLIWGGVGGLGDDGISGMMMGMNANVCVCVLQVRMDKRELPIRSEGHRVGVDGDVATRRGLGGH